MNIGHPHCAVPEPTMCVAERSAQDCSLIDQINSSRTYPSETCLPDLTIWNPSARAEGLVACDGGFFAEIGF